MKQMKRFLSLFLALILFVSSAPIDVKATEAEASSETVISVESKNVNLGEEVSIDVSIQNNPGILGATLEFTFDESLSLTGAATGDAFSHLTMTKPGNFDSPCRFVWDGQECNEEDIKDGTILTLTFAVAEDAEIGTPLAISVTAPNGDVCDNELNPIEVTTVDGSITVLDFAPGDVNGDGKVNVTDVISIRRYIVGGYGITLNENAANVNDDGKVSSADIILLRRYIAGGYDVELLPPSVLICSHEMEATDYVAPTCTEEGTLAHWYCISCHKYFSDEEGHQEITQEDTVIAANGHTVVIDPAVEPTYTETGLTEGSHCSSCGEILKAQEEIPVLQKQEYSITYYISNSDTYLAGLNIENPNPDVYATEEGLVLEDLVVDGYLFKGWYTSATGGSKVTEIAVGSTGKKTLYAQWEKVVYDVIFDSPDVPIDSVTYTVDKGITLTNPSLFGYSFIGWSNDNGFIVSSIKPGTIGNITLHANWTSNRNMAVSYDKYEEPIIIEDDINKQFLFVYDIGRIENIPLSQIEYFGYSVGLEVNDTFTVSNSISDEQAKSTANSISNATTRSSGWTLSENWEQIYSSGSEETDSWAKSEQRTDSEGNVVGGNYFVSNSDGGSSYVSTESGSSSSSSSKVTTEESKGINGSYDSSTEKYADAKLGVTNETEVGVEVSVPVSIAEVSAGVKNTTTISAEASSGRRDNESSHYDESESSYVGTVNVNDSSSYYNVSANNSSTWNSTSGYEKSQQTSRNTEVSTAVSEQILKTTSYDVSEALGGEKSQSVSVGSEDTRSEEYSTTYKYATDSTTTTERSIKTNGSGTGFYRLVESGTIHVYGVVGYDVATSSYYTYTFNVLADETKEFLDFSLGTSEFDDCENGLVTFEIPYEVNEYILGVTGKTEGLEIDLSGNVKGFEATENFDGTVAVPEYYSVDNLDGTYSAYETTALSKDAFKGNTEIKTVVLPTYITEIPANAFEGCTNLETVIAYGVTTIGDSAFKDCTSLKSFAIDNKVTSIGAKAFENVPEISIMAANTAVADAAINSGAKKISLNISKMEGSYDNKKIEILDNAEYFALISNGSSYSNLQIESDAAETFVSNVKFVDNTDAPLKLSSEKVTLARVTVEECLGFAMILTADTTELDLYGTVALSTSGDNAVISKNVSFDKANPAVSGELNLTGDYLVCGQLTNDKMLTFTEGEVVYIDEEEYNNMLTSCTITFDANGGSVSETRRIVNCGQALGTLPTPTRQYYTFQGWYTSDGTQITSSTTMAASADITVYAKWAANSYKVSWNTGTGYSITVKRTSSPNMGAATGTLSSGETVYYGDVLSVTYTASTGYTISSKGSTSITVTGNVTSSSIYATASVNQYKVSWNTGTGYSITVKRTSSPKKGAATGTLSSGAAIYYGDVLSVTYTASTGYTINSKGSTSITVTGNVTSSNIYATASVNQYKVSWNTGTGYSITVKRTSSPKKGAATGTLSSGAAIYYGDVLSVTYTASTGYSISSKGSTSITVTGNVTSSNIYATASLNSYTYNIVYRSSNGTTLGTSTATYKYGTTNTISPKAFSGYNTPGAQSVKWDSTSAKTITFTYSPSGVATSQAVASGAWWTKSSYTYINYATSVEYQNRTANSVQIRVVWTNTFTATGGRYGYQQCFNGSANGVGTGDIQICAASEWSSSFTGTKSKTATSGWITIPINTTNQTTVSVGGSWWTNGSSQSGSWSGTITIPAY